MKNKEDHSSFKECFRRATNQLVVLLLLSESPKYVYQITTELAARSNGAYDVAFVYPIVNRLKAADYIKERGKMLEKNRSRIYFEITEAGRAYLDSLIEEYNEMVSATDDLLAPYLSHKKESSRSNGRENYN